MLEKRWIGKWGTGLRIAAIVLIAIPMLLWSIFIGISYIWPFVLCVLFFGIPLAFFFVGVKHVYISVLLNLVIFVGLILSQLNFCYRPNAVAQTLTMFLSLYWFVFVLINIFCCFKNIRNYGRLVFLPLMISILTIPGYMGATYLGREMRAQAFDHNFACYEEYAHIVEKQLDAKPQIDIPKKEMPEKYQKLAMLVMAYKEKRGTPVVEFMYGGGIPVKHSIYAYIADDVVSDEFHDRWPHIQKIKDHWYRAGD